MVLNIKNREAHLLADELSELRTGESMIAAVTIALRERQKLTGQKKRNRPLTVRRPLAITIVLASDAVAERSAAAT